jgi:ketosteroid isomerase-like protein
MSENSETMRRGFAAFSRGDWEGCLAEVHPEIEWHLAFRLPDLPPGKEVFRGHEEVRQLFDAFKAVWAELTIEVEQVLHDEGDLLVSRVRFRGRGGGSGVEVDRRLFYVQRLREGKLRWQRAFDFEREALGAAGIERG